MTLHSLDHFHAFNRHRGAEGEHPAGTERMSGLAFLVGPALVLGAISAWAAFAV